MLRADKTTIYATMLSVLQEQNRRIMNMSNEMKNKIDFIKATISHIRCIENIANAEDNDFRSDERIIYNTYKERLGNLLIKLDKEYDHSKIYKIMLEIRDARNECIKAMLACHKIEWIATK